MNNTINYQDQDLNQNGLQHQDLIKQIKSKIINKFNDYIMQHEDVDKIQEHEVFKKDYHIILNNENYYYETFVKTPDFYDKKLDTLISLNDFNEKSIFRYIDDLSIKQATEKNNFSISFKKS